MYLTGKSGGFRIVRLLVSILVLAVTLSPHPAFSKDCRMVDFVSSPSYKNKRKRCHAWQIASEVEAKGCSERLWRNSTDIRGLLRIKPGSMTLRQLAFLWEGYTNFCWENFQWGQQSKENKTFDNGHVLWGFHWVSGCFAKITWSLLGIRIQELMNCSVGSNKSEGIICWGKKSKGICWVKVERVREFG